MTQPIDLQEVKQYSQLNLPPENQPTTTDTPNPVARLQHSSLETRTPSGQPPHPIDSEGYTFFAKAYLGFIAFVGWAWGKLSSKFLFFRWIEQWFCSPKEKVIDISLLEQEKEKIARTTKVIIEIFQAKQGIIREDTDAQCYIDKITNIVSYNNWQLTTDLSRETAHTIRKGLNQAFCAMSSSPNMVGLQTYATSQGWILSDNIKEWLEKGGKVPDAETPFDLLFILFNPLKIAPPEAVKKSVEYSSDLQIEVPDWLNKEFETLEANVGQEYDKLSHSYSKLAMECKSDKKQIEEQQQPWSDDSKWLAMAHAIKGFSLTNEDKQQKNVWGTSFDILSEAVRNMQNEWNKLEKSRKTQVTTRNLQEFHDKTAACRTEWYEKSKKLLKSSKQPASLDQIGDDASLHLEEMRANEKNISELLALAVLLKLFNRCQ